MMLPTEVEVAGTECAAGCSIFSQTVDRLPRDDDDDDDEVAYLPCAEKLES